MPFICGTPTIGTDEDLKRKIADLPEDQQRQYMADFPTPLWDSPAPEYVVDLTRVEEIQIARLGGHQVVVLRHPVYNASPIGTGEHKMPTDRVVFHGQHLAGAGPVTIWMDNKFLGFCDQPWLLAEVKPQGVPWLIQVTDMQSLGGPIELVVAAGSQNAEDAGDSSFTCYLDGEATGSSFSFIPLAKPSTSGMRVRIVRWLNGEQEEYGTFGEHEAYLLQTTHAPATQVSTSKQ
jgi:hypothetical protein